MQSLEITYMTYLLAFLLLTLSASTGERTISVELPEGWREVTLDEIPKLTPDLEPQNEIQRRHKQSGSGNLPLLAMRRDTDHGMAASVQIFVTPVPEQMRGASSVEIARVVAFSGFAAYGKGKYDIVPRETTVGGMSAAEWVMRYDLAVHAAGSLPMISRTIVIADGKRFYLIGYSGPASAVAEYEAFGGAVKSIAITR